MALIDNLRHGAAVFTSDGSQAGDLHAIVVDPRDNEVTHIVVNTGPHFPEPGFGAPGLVEIPIGQMKGAEEDGVYLLLDRDAFRDLPEYADRDHLPSAAPEEPEEPERGGPARALWNAGLAIAHSLASIGGIAVPQETFRRARFERHILNDAPVWRAEPHQHIGDIERVLIDEDSDEIRGLVVKRGVLFQYEVIVPIIYVTEILDGVVHVQISDEQLEGLQEFTASK
jgi:sporulation protein YlmC with PRC-barrel domain